MTRTQTPAGRRIRAFTKRAWIQQGTMALWLSALIGAGYGLLAVLMADGMTTVPGMSDMIPTQMTDLVTAQDPEGNLRLMTSYMLAMAPALLGALVGVVATLTLPGVVADDVSGGGIEVLLASPIPRRNLFQAYLGAGLLLAIASWAAATISFAGAITISALLGGTSLTVSTPYLAALVVLPLSMGVWSATITLFGALLYPRTLESRAGMNGGPIRLLAIAPTLFAVPAVVFLAQWVLPALGVILAATLLASLLIMRITARGFRSTRLLGS